MPLTPEMRRDVDQIRNYLFGGGYPDPVSNAEQLSFLFYFYLVEGIDAQNQTRAKVLKQPYESVFAGDWTLKNPLNAPQKGKKQSRESVSAGPFGPKGCLVNRWFASCATRFSRSSLSWLGTPP